MTIAAPMADPAPLPAARGPQTGRQRLELWLCLAAAAAVFMPSLGGSFVYDDLPLIAQNPGLHAPWDLGTLWGSPLWGDQLGHWRPLTAQLLALGWAMGGSLPIHLMALCLHLAMGAMVHAFGLRLMLPHRLALPAAAMFLLHPALAEPVAWCAGLNDGLWSALTMWALLLWLSRSGSRRRGPLAIMACALAMLAKEPGVAAPLLLVLADAVTGRGGRTVWRTALWAAALIGLWLLARMLVFGELSGGLLRATHAPDAVGWRLHAAVGGGLLRHLLWPLELGMFSSAPTGWWPTLLLALVVAESLWSWRRRPATRLPTLLAAAALLPPMLAPASLGPYPIADRYLILAAAALALRLGLWAKDKNPWSAAPLWLLAAIFSALCMERLPLWRDQATFVATSLQQHPEDPRLHLMQATLDIEAAQQGDAAAGAAAAASLRTARRLLHDDLSSQDARATLRRDVAVASAWSIMLDPAAQRRGQPDWQRVEHAFVQVVRDWPECADARVGLGTSRAATGRLELAELDLRRAIALDPGAAAARHNLARVLYQRGDRRGAQAQLQEAVRIRPDDLASRALLDQLGREVDGR